MNAVIANRATGDLRTVPTSDLDALCAEWLIVCRDDDFAPTLTDEEACARYLQPFKVEVVCYHHNEQRTDCPKLEKDTIRLNAPQDWTADDLAVIHHRATDTLRCSRLLWSIKTTEDRRKRPVERTTITIRSGWFGLTAKHGISITFGGRPSAAATAWLLQQAKVNEVAALLPADPSVADVQDGRSSRGACTSPLKDEPNEADFDDVLARVRRLFCERPELAVIVEEWLARMTSQAQTK